jgi:hypothetical protein
MQVPCVVSSSLCYLFYGFKILAIFTIGNSMITWMHPEANINLVVCTTNVMVGGGAWVGNIFFQLFLQ